VKSQGTNEVLLQGSLGLDGLYIFPHLALKDSTSTICLLSNSSVDSVVIFVSSGSNTQISNSIVNAVSDVKTTPSTSSQTIWHLRLGHPNANVLRLVLNHCNIPIVNKTMFKFCATCCVGKLHRLPSSLSQTIYSTPLELIYSDLWGPSHISSLNGLSYYINFVDAYSKFTWIHFLKNKSETFSVFQQFKTMTELQFDTKIKNVQID